MVSILSDRIIWKINTRDNSSRFIMDYILKKQLNIKKAFSNLILKNSQLWGEK